MPSFLEILNQLQGISRGLAVGGLLLAGSVMVLVRDWRASLLALLTQYLLAGFVLTRLVLPELALIKVLVGALVCPMLYLAARQAGWRIQPGKLVRVAENGIFPGGPAFRLLAVTLMTVLAVALNRTFPLPVVPPDVGLASYWLMLHGLLILMLTEEPLKAGQGLLMAIIGFELLYTLIEPSLALVWFWAAINLLVTLAIAYLAVARAAGSSEGDV